MNIRAAMIPTIFIIEAEPIVCDSLKYLFSSESFNVETYSDATAYLAAHNPAKYGCLLVDIQLPNMRGLYLLEQLVKINNPLPIIITGHNDTTLAVRL